MPLHRKLLLMIPSARRTWLGSMEGQPLDTHFPAPSTVRRVRELIIAPILLPGCGVQPRATGAALKIKQEMGGSSERVGVIPGWVGSGWPKQVDFCSSGPYFRSFS